MKRARRVRGADAMLLAALTMLAVSCHAQVPPQPAPPALPAPAPKPMPRPSGDLVIEGRLQQGGLARGRVPAGTASLSLDGQAVTLAPDGGFVIAFDRDAGPAAMLRATLASGRIVERALAIAPTAWQIEAVNASPTGSAGSAEFQRRRAGELAQINAARRAPVSSDGWRQAFKWPANGRISGRFGAQRIYRGQPGSYHSGVDVAAGTGTPFHAPADGVVTLAATSPFTLEGYLLIVDHGMGLSSAFLHASRLDVQTGDRVTQGQRLGAVGATGRTSGPHLHWGMKWHGARIDPLLLAGPMPGR